MRFLIFAIFLFTGLSTAFSQPKESAVKNRTICIDPGHGGTSLTDQYRVGPTGEREEWINLRVAFLMRELLEEKGAKVVMTRTDDTFIPLPDRSKKAHEHQADIFISIHHNATADSSVNFPIIYFHSNASENTASVSFGRLLAKELVRTLYNGTVTQDGNFVSLVSDHTVFPGVGASVLRNTYGITAVLAEASFFTHAGEEQLLKSETHNRREALAYVAALESFFQEPVQIIVPKNERVSPIPPFKAFQEAERMTPVAKRWYQDFREGQLLMLKKDSVSLNRAFELFTRSARSFPDSYVAAKCHAKRSAILRMMGKREEADQEALRVKEYYVDVPGL